LILFKTYFADGNFILLPTTTVNSEDRVYIGAGTIFQLGRAKIGEKNQENEIQNITVSPKAGEFSL